MKMSEVILEKYEWTQRAELLLGEKIELLKSANVLVVGVGGVGAYAAEMIVRSGVGAVTIVDADVVGVTNINRQLIALHSTVGLSKVDILAQRLIDINPDLKLNTIQKYVTNEVTDEVLDGAKFDFVIDAIDTLSPKVALIDGALRRNYPLVSSMGAGAKIDPTLVEVSDISKTHHCPLAHMLRKRLGRIGIKNGFYAVFSAEPARDGAMVECDEPNKKSMVGTISYMPAVFGCACASVAIRYLLGELS